MKEIPFPDGVIPLEIFVGSVAKNRVTEAVEGRVGVVDYGFNYTDRPVSLFLRIKAADAADFRLLRNEVFATFDVGSAFYVAESDVPSRVLKVVVDESYIPDRLTEEYADFDINCRTLDSVFWESKYTTLELHDSGYSATAEKYGLVDNIDDEKVKYRFEPERTTSQTIDLGWSIGSYNLTTGASNTDSRYMKTTTPFSTKPGISYVIRDLGTQEVNVWIWIFEYNSEMEFIGSTAFGTVSPTIPRSFVAQGNYIYISVQPNAGQSPNLNYIGNQIIPVLEHARENNTFSVYNAGNVTVEPESMMLNITVNAVQSTNNFTIRNKTTGEEIVMNRESAGNDFRIRGMVISLGSITNIFRDTNRKFISLVPGDNQFEITGATFDEAQIDFKYYYK